MTAKLYIGTFAALVWVAMVVAKHFAPDLDIGAIVVACAGVLTGLGVYHVGGPAPSPYVPPAAPPTTPYPEPVPPLVKLEQGGYATADFVWVLVYVSLVALGTLLLPGCASLTQAGNTAYSFEPVANADGSMWCCKFSAQDGKEYSSRNIEVIKGADGAVHIAVQEGASTAFQGQAIAGKALSILPSFSPPMLPLGPATLSTTPRPGIGL